MKMKFSNKTLLDSLSKSHDIQQEFTTKKYVYLIAGFGAGLISGMIINYFKKNQAKAINTNLRNLNAHCNSFTKQANDELIKPKEVLPPETVTTDTPSL